MTTVGVRPYFIRTSNGSGTTQDTVYTRRKHSRGAQEVWSALSRSSPVRYARGSLLYLQPRELQNVRSNSDPADIGLQCVLCVLTSYFKQEDTQHTVCLAGSTLSQVEPSLCSDLAHCPVQEAIFVLQVLEQSAAPRLTLPQSCVSQYCGSLYVRCQLRSAGSSRTASLSLSRRARLLHRLPFFSPIALYRSPRRLFCCCSRAPSRRRNVQDTILESVKRKTGCCR